DSHPLSAFGRDFQLSPPPQGGGDFLDSHLLGGIVSLTEVFRRPRFFVKNTLIYETVTNIFFG
ncbi:MAG TPA: hypothetical protein VGB16_02015, partial [candidate division Zixibacteria bacterium]